MSLSVTIVTPSLNQGRFIERTVQSVIQQNYPNLKHVVFDGGSTDETLPILQRYASSITFLTEKDGGQSNAINKGFSTASSDIIGWLNSDDVYYPGTIARVVAFFEAHPEVDILYGEANHIDEMDQIISHYPTEDWNIERLKQTCFISQPAVFFRQKIIAQHGLLDESLHYCMDYEYWLRLGLRGVKFAHLTEVLAGSRLYPETKTMRNPAVCYQEVMQMLRAQLGYIPLLWLLNYAILLTNQASALRYPGIRFILSALGRTSILAMHWNGFLRGLLMSFALPKTVLQLIFYKKKLAR